MSLLQDYAHDFDSDVRQRGEQCQRDGAVKIIDSGPEFVEAEVEGSHLYRVTVDRQPGKRAAYDCTCPYFDDHEICKHCWAVVMEAFQSGQLPGMTGTQPNPAGSASAEAGDEEDEDDDSPSAPTQGAPSAYPSFEDLRRLSPSGVGDALRQLRAQQQRPYQQAGRQPVVDSRKGDEDRWKSQLKRLGEAMRASPTLAPKPLPWPQGRRVLFVIRVNHALKDGLAITLMSETPKREGHYDKPRVLRITQWQVQQLPDADDRRIIQLLAGASRERYGYGYYSYEESLEETFDVDQSAYEDVLRLICATGRCRLQPSDGGNLVPISWDDGPAWEFCLQMKPSPGGRYLVLGGLLRRSAPIAEVQGRAEGESGTGREAIADVSPEEDAATSDIAQSAIGNRQSAISTQSIALSEPHLLLHGLNEGFAFIENTVGRLKHFDAFPLIAALRSGEKISVPLDQQTELLKMLLKFPRLPRLDLPPDLEIAEVAPNPKPRLKLSSPPKSGGAWSGQKESLVAKLSFDYDGVILERSNTQAAVVTDDGKKLLRRDAQREAQFVADLLALGFKDEYSYFNNSQDIRLAVNKLPKAVAELTRRGWTVEADGKLYRSAGQVNVSVSSGIDWFELHGDVSFDGGMRASLPRLLAALRKGESVVRLDDGTFGLLPEEWLKKYAGLAGLGETDGDAIKFSSRQIGFLDALLSAMPEARFDEQFSRARDELMRFGGVEAIDPPSSFVGTLRQYQKEGLGWIAFLRKFGFGGILADDMGLGKTVQVLALLEARRRERAEKNGEQYNAAEGPANDHAKSNGNGKSSPSPTLPLSPSPSLVVAPRSLVFNWKAEAAKFSPNLRVLDHTAVDRPRSADHFRDYDVVLTTYGTLRRDMSYFKDIRFDYAILDEAQAIKNASSESAKASRLIQADHRLALSGTPVQNHLGELWSLFDYLNPGMMGSVGVFRDLSADAANKDATARELLARALRPFILRRTKEQVAKDLPEKLEQTLYCELEKDQRKLYDELRDHYRSSLLERVAREGMNKAKIMVLEALLRLRQAACHPGLIDKNRSGEHSAKLDALMEHLDDVIDEGHKVLVFSQFTSFLAIVRERLDKQKTVYEYLDGRTKDRQERVNRFQTDESCKLFLISLKAGGLGLNLTAAEYVFLLDPWWNPAVEAQAIDRAHRIGQTQRVFAYRLIAKDTVEEKVLQLQQSKKDLADAIINADNSLIRGLSREDLEMLLS